MDKIDIFDTTLRDGEQAAGCRLGVNEKLKVASQLADLGVDIIEAGFPCSSPEDFNAVKAIADNIKGGPTICGLSRAVMADIDACGKSLKGAEKSRIHTGIGVSDIHIAGKFRDDKYGVSLEEKKATTINMAIAAVKRAKEYTDDVEFFTEDAGRSDPIFLFEIIEAIIDAGITVVNIPDTTGYAVPYQYGKLIHDIQTKVPNITNAIISVHCHDDLGLAVSNSLAGVENGARQVEGTINGIGERAGNAALEEIVMALRTRNDFYRVDTRLNSREFYRTSRMVAEAMGMSIPPNKAIIGENAFSHSSGIHVDGFLKERQTYEIMEPTDVGFPESKVILTARTGRHGVFHRIAELGLDLSEKDSDKVYQRFLKVADKKNEIFDEDLVAIMNDEIRNQPELCILNSFEVHCETDTPPRATVQLEFAGNVVSESEKGDGPVDAAYKAISAIIGFSPKLHRYEIQAVTEGTNALGKVMVNIEHNQIKVIGKGASTDIIEASIKAYIDGINKLKGIEEQE